MNKLLPVEPTEAMREAGRTALRRGGANSYLVSASIYKAMLEASPPVDVDPIAMFSPLMKPKFVWMKGAEPKLCTHLYTSPPDTEAKLKIAVEADLKDAIEAVLKADMTVTTSGGSYARHLPEPLMNLRKVFRKYYKAENTLIDKALKDIGEIK